MFTLLIFIAVLASLVLVHEIGHFIAAKKAGCTIEEFGLGFPPRLFGFKRGETLYSINALPFGGFVKIRGENGDDAPDEHSFVAKSFAWKTVIISAGVLMNVLMAYVLITITLIAGVPTMVAGEEMTDRWVRIGERHISIIEVLPESPALAAGFKAGDQLLSINGQAVESVEQAIKTFGAATEQPLTIQYQRGDAQQSTTVTPTVLPQLERLGVGVALSQTATLSYPWYVAPWYALKRTFGLLWLIIASLGAIVVNLVTQGSAQAEIAGPIGIAVITGEVARLGLVQLFQFAAMLSLNLAIINILPIPALDGGRLAMIVLERLRGRAMRVNVERWIHVFGFVFLITLMVAVTARDLFKYGGGFWQSLTNLFTS